MEQKKFILGLGNQKCGTTWLYKYLSESPKFAKGFTKEFHIWDRVDIPLFKNQVKKPLFNFGITRKARQYKMINSPNFYFDYFLSLYDNNKNISADITPSYSGLRAARLSNIQQNFDDRGVCVKVVILLREPLSRIKSAVRSNLDKGNYNEGITPFEKDFASALSQYYTTEHCSIRTRYQNIIEEAKQVFSIENIYVGFFENLFSAEEIIKLSEFLGIDANIDYAKVRVYKTKNKVYETKIDETIKEYYSDVYEFCYQQYPITKKLWAQ